MMKNKKIVDEFHGSDGRFVNGNSYYQLRLSTGGQPKRWENVDQFIADVNKYFQYIQENPLKEEQVVNKQWSEIKDYKDYEYLDKKGNPTVKSTKINHAYSKVKVKKMRSFTMQGLAVFLDTSRSILHAMDRDRPEFKYAFEVIRDIIDSQQFEGAAANMLNSSLISKRMELVKHIKTDHSINQMDEGELDNRVNDLISKAGYKKE